MTLAIKRAYEELAPQDGFRILVDRLWPRGISKESAGIDEWLKELAPSESLRRSYHEGRLTWDQFRRKYLEELKPKREMLLPIVNRARCGTVTLVFAARDEKHNNATVLKQLLQAMEKRSLRSTSNRTSRNR